MNTSSSELVRITGYRLGFSSYGGFEPVGTTWSRELAMEWTHTPAPQEDMMAVFGTCTL